MNPQNLTLAKLHSRLLLDHLLQATYVSNGMKVPIPNAFTPPASLTIFTIDASTPMLPIRIIKPFSAFTNRNVLGSYPTAEKKTSQG